MIVLDAGVIIAAATRSDAHHRRAIELFDDVGDDVTVNTVTLAEVLARPARDGRESAMLARLDSLGVTVTEMDPSAALRLARLRATTGLKLPDCCVLLTAEQIDGTIATFDDRLAAVAREHGREFVAS